MSETVFCPDKSFTIHIYIYIRERDVSCMSHFFLPNINMVALKPPFSTFLLGLIDISSAFVASSSPCKTSELKEREREGEEWVDLEIYHG